MSVLKKFPFVGFLLPVFLGILAFWIDAGFGAVYTPAGSADVMSRIFGSAKEGIGDYLFLKADSYFHGGVRIHFEDTAETLREEGSITGAHAQEESAPQDWIGALNNRIGVSEHYHLTDEKKKEMLPFLDWAVRLDPHNLDAILTTAYWLETAFDKTDDAIRTLRRGVADNPEASELRSALGDIYFKEKKDYKNGAFYFQSALERIDPKAAPHDAGRIAYYLAECYWNEGIRAEALAMYQNALRIYAATAELGIRETILRKIKELS